MVQQQHLNLLAQSAVTPCLQGIGPLGTLCDDASRAPSVFTKVLSTTIGVMTIVAFIWFLFIFLSAGLTWLGSGGDKAKLQDAQKRMTQGLIGLIIVISAIFLMKIISTIFNIDFLDITSLFNSL